MPLFQVVQTKVWTKKFRLLYFSAEKLHEKIGVFVPSRKQNPDNGSRPDINAALDAKCRTTFQAQLEAINENAFTSSQLITADVGLDSSLQTPLSAGK